MHVRREFEGLIYINGKELSDSLDEVWMKTDDHGRFHFYPKTDDFTVAALHPTGFGLATGVQLAKGQAITLAPWGQIEMKGNSETGISATRTGEGKNPVKINLQTFSHTGKYRPHAGRSRLDPATDRKQNHWRHTGRRRPRRDQSRHHPTPDGRRASQARQRRDAQAALTACGKRRT